MEQALSNEYWKKRCELAEKVIQEYDMTPEFAGDSTEYDKWSEFVMSPTDTSIELVDKLKYDFELEVSGYKIKMLWDMDDDPLFYWCELNPEWTLYRHIDCDVDSEKIYMVHKYMAVYNGVSTPSELKIECYNGKTITDKRFMEILLGNIIYNI